MSPPPAPSTLGDRLTEARHAWFVGREPELERFARALEADEPPFHLAFVHGPGGIGKTALLDEVARLAEATGAAVARLDGRDLTPAPAAFAEAVEAALDADADRRVLLVDTYEQIEGLDGWLRRTFAPGLRATDLIVIAGRNRPAPEWRSAWAGEVVTVPLRNLSGAEAEAYLEARGVPEGARAHVLEFTHGHPLALALVAERVRQGGGDAGAFDPADAPDLLGDLLGRFLSAVPSAEHRAALEAASVVPTLAVPLLEALLPDADAEGLFGWLRDLAFAETDARGVRLHDVVRETVEADLRWRDPERHGALHERARRFYAAHVRSASTAEGRRRILSDYLHLYRRNAVVQPLLGRLRAAWAEADLEGSGPLRDGDVGALRGHVARHCDAAEAERVAGWIERRPEAVEVFRTRDGAPAGFLLTLPLEGLEADERAGDPVVEAVWGTVGARLRAGERGLLFRSWLDAEAGQGVSAVQSLVFARTVERYLSTPGLAASVLLTGWPDLWAPVFALVGLTRWPEAEAEGAGLAAFGKDWRAEPPDAWLEALAAQAPSDAPPPTRPREAVVVLSKDEFGEAVREALKAYARPHRLAESPLLEARLVRDRDGEPVEALQALLREAAEQLDQGIRERPYFRALDLTYLRPAPTQAIAAERLDLPFSTFRRHLRRGVDHVVEALWKVETGG